ncbi:MAG: hypothetical protein AAGM84_03290 [Pseudomonadota bacterium]
MRPLTVIVIASLVLGACGLRESRVNPFNWFGNSRSEPRQVAVPAEAANPLIPRQRQGIFARQRALEAIYTGTPVAVVSDMRVERVPGGAIIRATGVDQFQGLFDVQLTPENDGEAVDGVLSYRLEARRPDNARPGGPEATRRVTAALALTDQELRGVRTIRVAGVENVRSSRRR